MKANATLISHIISPLYESKRNGVEPNFVDHAFKGGQHYITLLGLSLVL